MLCENASDKLLGEFFPALAKFLGWDWDYRDAVELMVVGENLKIHDIKLTSFPNSI